MTNLAASPRRFVRFVRREPAVPAIYLVLAVVIIVYGVLDPSIFGSDRATILLAQKLPLILVAVGQTIVFLTRGLDLSVGGVVALSNVVIVTQMGPSPGAGGIASSVALGVLGGVAAGVGTGIVGG